MDGMPFQTGDVVRSSLDQKDRLWTVESIDLDGVLLIRWDETSQDYVKAASSVCGLSLVREAI